MGAVKACHGGCQGHPVGTRGHAVGDVKAMPGAPRHHHGRPLPHNRKLSEASRGMPWEPDSNAL